MEGRQALYVSTYLPTYLGWYLVKKNSKKCLLTRRSYLAQPTRPDLYIIYYSFGSELTAHLLLTYIIWILLASLDRSFMKNFMILNNIKNFTDIVRREKYEVSDQS